MPAIYIASRRYFMPLKLFRLFGYLLCLSSLNWSLSLRSNILWVSKKLKINFSNFTFSAFRGSFNFDVVGSPHLGRKVLQDQHPAAASVQANLRNDLHAAVLHVVRTAVQHRLWNGVQDRVRAIVQHELRAGVQANLPRRAGQAMLHQLRAGVLQRGADDLRDDLQRWLPECSSTGSTGCPLLFFRLCVSIIFVHIRLN